MFNLELFKLGLFSKNPWPAELLTQTEQTPGLRMAFSKLLQHQSVERPKKVPKGGAALLSRVRIPAAAKGGIKNPSRVISELNKEKVARIRKN